MKPDPGDGPAPADAADASSINILIVDDEPANLVVLETILTDPLYRLVRAASAEEALLALMRDEFALLILDVRMPTMDGFELAQMIKERKKTASVPIIFLTAYYDEDQHALEGYGSGAVDFLSKPVNAAVLRSKVAVFADLHRKTRAVGLANEALLAEVQERRRAQERLLQLNQTLEERVDERTEALRRADLQLREMMTSITDALFMLDRSWCVTYANERAATLLKTELHRLERACLLDLPLEGLGAPFRECAEIAISESRTTSFTQYFPDLGKWLQCHCYPSVNGLSVYFLDITDRMEVEERREHLLAAEQAARSEGDRVARAKDDFLASLSHELRTPLAAIIGWAGVLQRPDVDASTLKRGIDVIARNAKAQSQLVADLLDVSRAAAGKLKVEFRPSDMNVVAAVAADTAGPAAQAKGVGIQTRLESDRPAWVMGNEERLHQAVSNLISNALKFTPAGGTILVETASTPNDVELRVVDDGEGISPDFLPHLFERFSQADGSTARHHGGLGLGLAIVKNLVELHDGTVHAFSDGPGRGATFSVRLPAAPVDAVRTDAPAQSVGPPAAVAAGATGRSAHSGLQGISVLLVDDHPDVLEVHRRLLAEAGAAVHTAISAEEALNRIRVGEVDVLLSDLGMPGMDGYSLIRAVRQDLGLAADRLPAAAVTAFVRAEDRERALAHGYQRVLQKPVTLQDLVRAVRELSGLDAPTHPAAAHATIGATGTVEEGTSASATGVPLRGLFVEDNLDLQEQIGWMLGDAGIDVVACGSAEEALDRLETNGFDVIVADISLPGLSGVELAKLVLSRDPEAWFVFSTGYAMDEGLRKLGKNVRALVKPFEFEQLQELVDEIRSRLPTK
jgi:hypothetical protein